MRNEYQIKIAEELDPARLIDLGAEPLGSVTQKDTYLCCDNTLRIREEGGQFFYTEKSFDKGRNVSLKDVADRIISKDEALTVEKRSGIKAIVCKTRELYRIGDVIIALDDVEHLGSFFEIRSSSEESIFQMMEQLGFSKNDLIRESYLDMIVAKSLPKYVQLILRFHDKVGELAFGITSGILTTVGLLTGINSATSSRLAVISSIAVIAMADSMSDAYGMYMSKISERGNSRKAAMRYALGTLAGKFFFPFTFILPVIVFPLSLGVWIDLAWGAVALALLSAENAIVYQKPVKIVIARNLGLATLIVLASSSVGLLLNKIFS